MEFKVELTEEETRGLVYCFCSPPHTDCSGCPFNYKKPDCCTYQKKIADQIQFQLSSKKEDEVEKQELTCPKCGVKCNVELPKGAKITRVKWYCCGVSLSEDEVEELAEKLQKVYFDSPKITVRNGEMEYEEMAAYRGMARWLLENYQKKEGEAK